MPAMPWTCAPTSVSSRFLLVVPMSDDNLDKLTYEELAKYWLGRAKDGATLENARTFIAVAQVYATLQAASMTAELVDAIRERPTS
jgi:hypothetical protein